jgi:hypothetical protein
MKGRFFKSIGIVCLSVLFAYSGIAWALDDCLRESEETVEEQSAIGNFEIRTPSRNFVTRSADAPDSEVHCLITRHEFDAAVQSSAMTSLTQPRKGLQLTFPLASGLTSLGKNLTSGRSLCLDSFVTFSPPGFLSRYLLFSIFLI